MPVFHQVSLLSARYLSSSSVFGLFYRAEHSGQREALDNSSACVEVVYGLKLFYDRMLRIDSVPGMQNCVSYETETFF